MDENWFDKWLKANLYRDVVFRLLIWTIIAGLTTHYASRITGFDPVQNLKRTMDTLGPVINVIGVWSIVFALFAALLKDLEHVAPSKWGPDSRRGKVGGFVRRVAGDLTLWVMGALITLISVLTVAVLRSARTEDISPKDEAAIGGAYFFLTIFLVIIAFINIVVRRKSPPLAGSKAFSDLLTSTPRVLALYVFAIGAAILFR